MWGPRTLNADDDDDYIHTFFTLVLSLGTENSLRDIVK